MGIVHLEFPPGQGVKSLGLHGDAGTAKLSGLVASSFPLPPQGATRSPYAFTIMIPIMSFCAARSG